MFLMILTDGFMIIPSARLLKGRGYPTVDIEKENGKYLLKADFPKVRKEDIHVELEDEKENCHGTKRNFGSFYKAFRVPKGTTRKDIKVEYHNGFQELSIQTPKV